jgi:hypothetical protein
MLRGDTTEVLRGAGRAPRRRRGPEPSRCVTSGPLAFPRSYFISPSGAVGNTGDSPGSPLPFSAIPGLPLGPGDRICLEGGRTFFGSLVLGPPVERVIVETYGSGAPATIDASRSAGAAAVCVYNTHGVVLRNLRAVGSRRQAVGFHLLAYETGNRGDAFGDLLLDHVEASGFKCGILVEGRGASGFHGVRIVEADAHHNIDGGIAVHAEGRNHRDIHIARCCAHENPGDPKANSPSGSGIVLAGVNGGVVEKCVAYRNGGGNGKLAPGPIGIWAYHCNNITIQDSESYDNRTASENDGGGFDFDGGVTNSVMRNNYSHDNHGSGFLACYFPHADPFADVVFEHNVSVNDGLNNRAPGGISSYFDAQEPPAGPLVFRHNTVSVGPSPYRSRPSGASVIGTGKNIRLEHNRVTARGGVAPYFFWGKNEPTLVGNEFNSAG